jgi:hypothetical protein
MKHQLVDSKWSSSMITWAIWGILLGVKGILMDVLSSSDGEFHVKLQF